MPTARSRDSISPELALVDANLDSAARDALPDAPDCLTPHDDGSERSPATHRRRVVRTGSAAIAGVVAVVAIVTLAVAWSSDGPEPRPGVDERASTTTQGRPNGPSRLRWTAVPGAAQYNVILWRNGKRALDLWPRSASVRVPAGRLAPGRYQWFVYPAFRESGKLRYGPVAARGTIRV